MTKPNAIEEIMAAAIWGRETSNTVVTARTILAALDAAGLAVVPKEATVEMAGAGSLGSSKYAFNEACSYWPRMVTAFDPTTWKPKA
ncbi:MAG: hypothetical protein ACR2RF_32180 [Geminicoccaceae bacterium]